MQKLSQTIIASHLEAIASLDALHEEITACGQAIVQTLKRGGKILLCGNGGSAGDAQHIATELVCRFETKRRALPALALTTDTSALTAIANDFSFDRIFSRQIEALGQPKDCLVAITTSGNSGNVISAVKAAKLVGMQTIGLLGRDGGALKNECHQFVIIPARDTARIQECHILIGHIWCAMVDQEFSGGD
jgi:phosphoheptose isomerase